MEPADVTPNGRRGGHFDLCDVVSPPSVTKVAIECGLRGLDNITNRRWDLTDPKDQVKVRMIFVTTLCVGLIRVAPSSVRCTWVRNTEISPTTWNGLIEIVCFLSVEIAEMHFETTDSSASNTLLAAEIGTTQEREGGCS